MTGTDSLLNGTKSVENLASDTNFVPNGTKPVACTADGCDRPCKARGFCAKHYARLRRTGDPHTVRRAGRPTADVSFRMMFGESSARTVARFSRAFRLYAELDALRITPAFDRERAITAATRPNGSFNFAKFERIAEVQFIFGLRDAGLLNRPDEPEGAQ